MKQLSIHFWSFLSSQQHGRIFFYSILKPSTYITWFVHKNLKPCVQVKASWSDFQIQVLMKLSNLESLSFNNHRQLHIDDKHGICGADQEYPQVSKASNWILLRMVKTLHHIQPPQTWTYLFLSSHQLAVNCPNPWCAHGNVECLNHMRKGK